MPLSFVGCKLSLEMIIIINFFIHHQVNFTKLTSNLGEIQYVLRWITNNICSSTWPKFNKVVFHYLPDLMTLIYIGSSAFGFHSDTKRGWHLCTFISSLMQGRHWWPVLSYRSKFFPPVWPSTASLGRDLFYTPQNLIPTCSFHSGTLKW